MNAVLGAASSARSDDAPKPSLVVRNARIITFDKDNRVLEEGAVEILSDGTIGAIRDSRVGTGDLARAGGAQRRSAPEAHDFLDAGGRLLMPALINCHTHLYSTLARGMSLPGPAPKNFPEILKKLWWRLDRALNGEDVYYSAMVGLIDSAKNGVGTLVDHHSSPNACPGSLDRIAQAFLDVGLRGVACYETSDRNGAAKAEEGIRENIRFLESVERYGDRMVRGSFGLHASFTLSDRTLRRAAEAAKSLQSGFHVHVAEDQCDVAHARKQHRKSPVARLHDLGVLDSKSIAAHCVHVSPADIRQLAKRKINVVHNPQSNCNNAVGAARLPEMAKAGVTVGLGSDGYSPRIWEEFKAAFHVQKLTAGDPRVAYAEAYAAALLNNRKIARKAWGLDIGAIVPGARADLLLVDYWPPTPLTRDNLFGHFLFGIANAPVDTLIVNGRFVVRDKKVQTVDERAVMEKASAQAKALWRRF